jgi:membrane-bound ClpP family serine protease
MSTDLFWPIACMAVGLVLLIVEVFVPSGGLIGFLAVGLLAVSLYQAFMISTTIGLVFVLSLMGLLPATLALAVHLWPRTPMGKWIFLKPPEPEDVTPEHEGPRLDHLIGQFGRTLTPLRPSGLVDFEGRRLDSLSEEGLIPSGTLVRAVQIRGGQLIVRTVPSQTLDEFAAPLDAS